MRKKYVCGWLSKKYWKYIFWFILDCCCVNVYFMYKEVLLRIIWKKCYIYLDFVIEFGCVMIGNFIFRKRVCVWEFLVFMFVENNWVNYVFFCLDGKCCRCKGCYVLNICKEVVMGCFICNIYFCKNCYFVRYWVKKLVEIRSLNVIDFLSVIKLWLWLW